MAMQQMKPKTVEITYFEKAIKTKDEYSTKAQKAITEYAGKAEVKAKALKKDAVVLCKNPQFQTISISTGAGAIILGTTGGAFGLASGVIVGGAAGVVPALLTFGLSIPAGAALGGGIGMCTGAVVGTGTGAVGGGLAGYTGYKYRVEIKDGVIYVKTTAIAKTKQAQIKIMGAVDGTKIKVKSLVATTKAEALKAAKITQAKVEKLMKQSIATGKKLMEKPIAIAQDPKVQVTTAGAAAGTLTCGAVGGSAGTLVGAAVGVVPALFTFGLSIPIGAAIGGGIGLAAGGSVGAVGGGTAGYVGYTYRKELKESKSKAWRTVLSSSDYVKSKAKDSKDYVESALGFSGTGGTA